MTRKRNWLKCINLSLMLIVLCGAGQLGFAQTDRGSVSGTVTDPGGLAVIGARVTITNVAMGTQNSTVTTDTGNYTIPQLSAGVYSLMVDATGFNRLVRAGITVSVGQTAHLDLKLDVGENTTTITVTADAPLLQTESPQNNVEVTSNDMNELPLNIIGIGAVRDPKGFAALAPGTIVGAWGHTNVSGATGGTYRVIMDGLDATSAVRAAISDEVQPSVESLNELSLMQGNYSTEFGQAAGGIFNYTSKSGGNRLHGTLFNYYQNEDLDAAQPFNYTQNGSKYNPVERMLDFGGSLGGPLVIPHLYNGRGKTFFFASFEEYHNAQTLNKGTITVPTTAYRSGDLSSLLLGPMADTKGNPIVDCLGRTMINGAIYNPATTRTATCLNGSTATVRDPFPNNFIGAPSTWDSVSQKILSYIPLPSGVNASQPTDNYPNMQPNDKYQYLPSIKIDHSINQALHISAYFTDEFTNKYGQADGLPAPIGSTRYLKVQGPQLYSNLDYTATPNMVLHAGFGFTRHANQQNAAQTFDQQLLGLPTQVNLPGGGAPTFPVITGLTTNRTSIPQLGVSNNPYYDNNWQPTGSVTWVHGAHTLKAGGDMRHQLFSIQDGVSTGSYVFSSAQTSLPSASGQSLNGGSIGDGFASFALGQVYSAVIGNAPKPWYVRKQGSIYALDVWKLTRKITLNYGLRWDFQQMQHEQKYRQPQFSPTVLNPTVGNLAGGTVYEGWGSGRCNCVFEKFYPWAIQPRLGIMYQLDSKTVIHVGSGFYSGQFPFMNEESPIYTGYGWNTVTISSPSYGISAGQFSNGVPYTASQMTATNFSAGAYPNVGSLNAPPAFTASNAGHPSRFIQTTVGVEREIAYNLTIGVDFLDRRGVWLNSDGLVGYNRLTALALAKYGLDITNASDFSLLTQSISSAAVKARGFAVPYSSFPSTASLAQSLRPFPQFSSLTDRYEPDGNVWYDALQIKLTKRLHNGLALGANYTWSKNLGTVADGIGAGPLQDPTLPPKSQKTYESIDVPQMLKANFTYELPTLGFAKTGWKHAIFSGWTADGIFKYMSGFPMSTPSSTSTLTSVTFGSKVFANRVAGQPLFLHSLNKHDANPYTTFFLNPAAWSNPTTGIYSTSKGYYSDFRAPRYPSEQLGFGKYFSFREGMRISLRTDLFNVFNRWAYPGLNMGSPFATRAYASNGAITNGFGYLGNSISNAGGTFSPRTASIVLRVQF